MRESSYNLYLQDDTGMVIYNAAADEVIALTPALAELFYQNRRTPEVIKSRHPNLFAYLLEKSVFVDDAADEAAHYIAKKEEEENHSKTFSLIINPTLACNIKCWYCYETHTNMPAMSEDVKESVTALIRRLTVKEDISLLKLSFFGGEPLLYFERIVKPLLIEAKQQCEAHGISLMIHFTTNGYLLTPEVLKQLKEWDVSFQITLDGNEMVHNTVRITRHGEPTYATIVSHIRQALDAGFSVGVRFNYTAHSLPSFIDIVTDFRDIPTEQKTRLNFGFQRVWQDNEGDVKEIESRVADIERAFEEAELPINTSNDYAVPYCYADSTRTVVVNYNGDLFKCTARDFVTKQREGTLLPTGELRWNNKYHKRIAIRRGGDYCRKCRIYPICHGGCSQMKLEAPAVAACPKGYDDDTIAQIMKGRALFILKCYKKSLKQVKTASNKATL
jgi:uncharacterized protein